MAAAGSKSKALSQRKVETAAPGEHGDGDGLWLIVRPSGARRWELRFRWKEPGQPGAGRQRQMGLGSFPEIGLARAREKAAEARRMIAEGVDPIAATKIAPVAIPTFGDFADTLVDTIEGGFRNAKHVAQWRSTLATHAAKLRPRRVDEIETADVLAVLSPIWTIIPETAARLRGRIERVLDAARAKGFRTGTNPALWRGHLDALLPRRQKLSRGHHPALPFKALPDLIARLRASETMSARCLEFTILTAARSGESRGATWGEIDLDGKVWIIPARRMKAGREHRVPLTPRMIEILDEMAELRPEHQKPADLVFPGRKRGAPISDMTMAKYLGSLVPNITVHGFRSTFRDWCGETSNFPRELAEQALAHVTGGAVEQAYRRGDALEKRWKLMDAWERYCSQPAGAKVINLRRLPLRPRTAAQVSSSGCRSSSAARALRPT